MELPSSKITISAGSLTGITAITAVDDTDVELTETIIVDIDDVSGASESGTQQVTINLTDNDLTSVSSITVDKTSIDENGGVAVITATISDVQSKDVTIPLTITGTAAINTDYTYDFSSYGKGKLYYGGNGNGSAENQLNSPEGIAFDSEGNLYIADYYNQRVLKVLKSSGDIIVLINDPKASMPYPVDIHLDSSNNIYVLSWNEGVKKYSQFKQSNGQGGFNHFAVFESNVMTSGPIGAVNMHVSENGDIYVVSRNINNIYKSTKQDPTASILFNDNDFHLANSIALDSTGNVYVSGQNMQLRKWTKSTSVSSTLEGGYGSRAIHIDSNDNLLIAKDGQYSGYNSEGLLAPSSGATIDKYKINTQGISIVKNLYTQNIVENDYYIGINSIIKDDQGSLFLALGKNTNQSGSDFSDSKMKKDRILIVRNEPAIEIEAGSSTGTITLTGTNDSTYELDETIIVTPSTSPTNATSSISEASTITITDDDDPPVGNFSFKC